MWRTAKAADDPQTFELLAYVEGRIASGSYAHAGIAFDPRKEGLTADTYNDEPKRRRLPSHVFAVTTRSGTTQFEPTKGRRARKTTK